MYPKNKQSGLTIFELLAVVAIIGILASVILARIDNAKEATYEAMAKSELNAFAAAMNKHLTESGRKYPPDADRNIPAGLEAYLNVHDWPDGPWPGSVYDWDNWTIAGEKVYQISIRFCPRGGPLSACRFPEEDWAENFGVNSAYFYCFDGPCRSHNTEPQTYPGYCVNCSCKEMEFCL